MILRGAFWNELNHLKIVMAALVAATHELERQSRVWVAGTSPAMTMDAIISNQIGFENGGR